MTDDSTTPEPAHTPPVLEQHLCFTLYAASRAITGAYRPLLDPLGLTYPQYLVLVALGEHGTVTVKELVAVLQLDYGTVTPLIKRLEANGLVKRERRADDERVVEIALTERGLALHRHLSTVPPAIGDAVGLAPDEIATIQELVRRLTVNVTRHNAAVAARRTA
ncbi:MULTISPECIES: MarR family winged helix-turn-helix transcriptional regulator [Streptomyces]|uniref:MarR family transcriptional regulator n=1 Tax=Streptomyces parvulus TaxID=146923 RepID=A0A191VAV6_9ACTN|nr:MULTISPECIES: MarR family transcriptional regulator [Streptomyces]ANJ12045.1 MarR family transcriptional regulator [Streptomyces parvulus]MZD59245.1 MarR family transcriptional regulator [Streptomyces sp. SID5606]GGS05826.1 MarR family transcriptional regulator [Streptomyces parvulus]